MSEFPEHDKVRNIGTKAEAINEFLSWFRRRDRFESWVNNQVSTKELVAQYFGIDLQKYEAEKDELVSRIGKGPRRV